MRSPIKKAGKGQKKRGEVGRRGRLVEGVGVRGRANLWGWVFGLGRAKDGGECGIVADSGVRQPSLTNTAQP